MQRSPQGFTPKTSFLPLASQKYLTLKEISMGVSESGVVGYSISTLRNGHLSSLLTFFSKLFGQTF